MPEKPPKPYAWEMVLHLADGSSRPYCRVAPSAEQARRWGMLLHQVERVDVLEPLTRDEYHRVHGHRRTH